MQTEHVEQANPGRRYEFDWLRGLGAVLVVVAHCAILFAPWMPAVAGLPRFLRDEKHMPATPESRAAPFGPSGPGLSRFDNPN